MVSCIYSKKNNANIFYFVKRKLVTLTNIQTLVFLFTSIISVDLVSDEIFQELILRNEEDKSIFYLRSIRASSGQYYWKMYDSEDSCITEEVTSLSEVAEDSHITVYFQSFNTTFEILAHSVPALNIEFVYSLPLSFPILSQ